MHVASLARRVLPAVIALTAALAAPAAARAAEPKPFGKLDCRPQEGVRFCPGSVATRVKTFDGVPLDVNVTLPAGGDGGFPLVVQLHGYGGRKGGLSESKEWAAAGYAALTYTARGFGDSCGSSASRAADPAGCAAGWVKLADSRFEAHDTQHLAGLLADEGLIDPQRIGVTGVSYGGGQSMHLAALRDRIRRADGSYVPWRSPAKGLPMRIAAAAPVIPWSDLTYSLVPNGRTLDYIVTADEADLEPIGVPKQSYISGLYALGQASGYYAPPGADPDADLNSWYARITAGEPYDGDPVAEGIAEEIATNHSAYYLDHSQPPAPLLISNGFTDDLFPADESLRFANRTAAEHPGTPVSQLFFDYGHARGQNKPADAARLRTRIHEWFDRYVKGDASVETLQGVEAMTQTCPKDAPSGGPFQAPTWSELHPGEVRFIDGAAQTLLSSGGDPNISKTVDPIAGGGACATTDAADQAGTATYRMPKAEGEGYTLLGSPTVIADLKVTGENAQVAARLWDVAPDESTQTLVARGLYRPDAVGRQVFQLHANGWRFEPGHTPKLELLGSDAPYGRASNGQFAVEVSNLDLRLPTREPPGTGAVQAPADPFVPAGAALAPGYAPPSDGGGKGPSPAPNDGAPGSSHGARPGGSAGGRSRCLAPRARGARRGIGRVRLGARRGSLAAIGLSRRGSRRLAICVRGGGHVVVVTSRAGRARLVLSTARGHSIRGVRRGDSLRKVRRERRIGRGVYSVGRTVLGVRRGRVRWVGVADRALARSPRALRAYARLARL